MKTVTFDEQEWVLVPRRAGAHMAHAAWREAPDLQTAWERLLLAAPRHPLPDGELELIGDVFDIGNAQHNTWLRIPEEVRMQLRHGSLIYALQPPAADQEPPKPSQGGKRQRTPRAQLSALVSAFGALFRGHLHLR